MANKCKVCLVGEMAVGKTSLASRFVTGSHSRTYKPNFTAHHFTTTKKDVNGQQSIFIWDTAGSERFRSMAPIFLRGAHCCMLTFSLTHKASFSEIVNYWTPSVRDGAPHAKCVLVANKVDEEEEREVTVQEISKFCNEERIKYFETSALTGFNVNEVFSYAAKIASKQQEKNSFFDSFQLYDIPQPGKKNKWCCV